MTAKHTTVTLTERELSAVSEAIRYAQQTSHEGTGYHDRVLASVQRKLGDVVGCGEGDEPS